MRNDAAEDGWLVRGMASKFGVKILKLDLLPAEVLWEAAELAAFVLIAFLIVEGVRGSSVTKEVYVEYVNYLRASIRFLIAFELLSRRDPIGGGRLQGRWQ